MPGPDDRAVSEVMGAVLIFGFLVISFAVYQGIVIPEQNRAAEFEHNQDAQKSIQELRNAVRQTAAVGSEQSVSVTLGATYPQRVIGLNPGASAGSLHTEVLGAITVRNVTATDPEIADYIGSDTTTLGAFESNAVVYRPVYSHYAERPDTYYENTLAFNRFGNGVNLTITDQAVVNGRTITLIALAGNVSEAQRETVTVDTTAVSTATNTVTVTNESGPVTLTVPTRLSADDWADLLEDELDPAGNHSNRFVSAVEPAGPDHVEITLEPGVTYELRLAEVAVGAGTPAEGPKYVVDVEGDDTSVIEDGTQRLVVEVRDRFNNPVSNVTVRAAPPALGSVSPGSVTTDGDGRAAFVYAAPSDVDGTQDVDVEVAFDGDGTRNETVTFDLRVLDADGSGGNGSGDGGSVNPGRSGSIILDDQSPIAGASATEVTITLRNTTDDPDVTMTAARVSFFFNGNPGAGDTDPTEVDLYSSAQGVDASSATTLPFGDGFVALDERIPLNPTASDGSNTTVIDLRFDQAIESDDFYVIAITYSNGDTYTYFVSHPD